MKFCGGKEITNTKPNTKNVILKYFLLSLIFIILTIITQVGGILYILSIYLAKKFKLTKSIHRLSIFIVLYLISTFILVPIIAPVFGREKIDNTDFIEPHTFFYTLMNRNYVSPELNELLRDISIELEKKHEGIKLVYLDANFPFIDKFPLLPHLSHNDGNKIDICFIYQDSKGKIVNNKRSVSGYGVFEAPNPSEFDQTSECKKKGYWQYDYPKYLTFGSINDEISFSEIGTKNLINLILRNKNVEKLFLEPHLVKRLNLNNSKIRFHGCRAVRHDDHIHLQIK